MPSLPEPKQERPHKKAPARRIVVRPEDVVQRDPRPWGGVSFTRLMAGFLALSALVVAVGLLALAAVAAWAMLRGSS